MMNFNYATWSFLDFDQFIYKKRECQIIIFMVVGMLAFFKTVSTIKNEDWMRNAEGTSEYFNNKCDTFLNIWLECYQSFYE